MMHYPIIIVFLFVVEVRNQQFIAGCGQYPQSIQNKNRCIRCLDGYESSKFGICYPEANYKNCQFFGGINSCLRCKPSFKFNLKEKRCEKIDNGCLIVKSNNQCQKCVQGAQLKFGSCDISYINCVVIRLGRCLQCALGYFLLPNNRCFSSSTSCKFFSRQTGLCKQCFEDYVLVGYVCMNLNVSKNCLIGQNINQCLYCKTGYYLLFGFCTTYSAIRNLYQFNQTEDYQFRNCGYPRYFDARAKQCINKNNFCDKYDFGFHRCGHCLPDYVLMPNSICRHMSHVYCAQFDEQICVKCNQSFYMNLKNQCIQFPPYCTKVYDQICIQCSNNFILNTKYQCQDPNCLIYQSQTFSCIKCKDGYKLSRQQNKCIMYDTNCAVLPQSPLQIRKCRKCKNSYSYDSVKELCVFTDSNCKFNLNNEFCQECNTGYYYNKITKSCIQYPQYCKMINDIGSCQLCEEGYFVLSGNCTPNARIPNCLKISTKSSNFCQICVKKFFLNQKFLCQPLPIFCRQIDMVNTDKRRCKQCQFNAILRGDGLCYDSNCLFFDTNAQCLGCMQGFQFNEEGICVEQVQQRNCREYQKGRCKVCADRHYFDSRLQCTPVEGKCNKYDVNSGECLSCYKGYQVQDGICVVQSQIKKCVQYEDSTNTTCRKCYRNYQLNETTKKCQYNQFGCILKADDGLQCLKCKEMYILDKNRRYCLKVNISVYNQYIKQSQNIDVNKTVVKQPVYVDQKCRVLNANKTSCLKCISRNYFNIQKNKCVEIDPNCREFSQDTGQCKTCYSGYILSKNKMKCQVQKSLDDNCKIFFPNSPKCSQCYPSFYYQQKLQKCTPVDKLCSTYNPSNGECTNCYAGYTIKEGRCVIDSQIKSDNIKKTQDKQPSK